LVVEKGNRCSITDEKRKQVNLGKKIYGDDNV
jgi:hypothetical protein